MIEVNKVNEIVELFEVQNDKNVQFEARYFSDIAYYSATDANELYLFDENGKILAQVELSKIDVESIINKHNFDDNAKFAYAIYEDEIVYTVSETRNDYYVSLSTEEVVLKIRKGIEND